MKTTLTIEASQWKKALAQLSPIVGTKNALPILVDVVLKYDAERDIFTLTCSDSETWITIDCIDKEGNAWIHMIEDDLTDRFQEVAIDFASLKEAVSLLPSAQLLEVHLKDNMMKVNYGIGEFEMACEPAETFPQPQPVAAQGEEGALCRFTLNAAKLLPLMSAAAESTANWRGGCVTVEKIKSPGEFLMLADSTDNASASNDCYTFGRVGSPTTNGTTTNAAALTDEGRHEGVSNVCFADGHVLKFKHTFLLSTDAKHHWCRDNRAE